jgi:hypothetical protein
MLLRDTREAILGSPLRAARQRRRAEAFFGMPWNVAVALRSSYDFLACERDRRFFGTLGKAQVAFETLLSFECCLWRVMGCMGTPMVL